MAMVTGCGVDIQGDLILVAHPERIEYMMNSAWGDTNRRTRLIRQGVLQSHREWSSLHTCGVGGIYCTSYCMQCARKAGIVW